MRAKVTDESCNSAKRTNTTAAQAAAWLRSVVQGYFNYYAVREKSTGRVPHAGESILHHAISQPEMLIQLGEDAQAD